MKTGRIYKIISTQGNECYVGSTFNTTRDRFRMHKGDFTKWKNGNYDFISVYELFEKYSIENCKILLIKEYEFCDRMHMQAYEQLWINRLNPINKTNPFGSGIKALRKQKDREYNRVNKKARNEYQKQYRKVNKELIKSDKKNYYTSKKESILLQKKTYYETNKETIKCKNKEYASEKVPCTVCNCEIRKDSMGKHLKSKKHQNNLNTSGQ